MEKGAFAENVHVLFIINSVLCHLFSVFGSCLSSHFFVFDFLFCFLLWIILLLTVALSAVCNWICITLNKFLTLLQSSKH